MVLTMERWNGKVAIVTGASGGIGAAIVEKLVSEGLIVVGLARRKELMDAMAVKLADRPGKLHPYKADVSKEDELVAAFRWTEEHLGPVQVLVNNAGIVVRSTICDGDSDQLRAVIDTNLMAAVFGSREAVRGMRKHQVEGHIINVGSVAGHFPIKAATTSLYVPSKYALTGLTEVLRQELQVHTKTGIRVTDISPGVVQTDMFTGHSFPHLSAEDIADSVQYVLSTPPNTQVQEIIIRPVGEYL